MNEFSEAVGSPAAKNDQPSLLYNLSWIGIANVAVKPFWFVFITAVSMRLLGVAEYGVMNAALSLCLITSSFTDLGMARYTVREVSQDRSKAAPYFTNFIAVRAGNVTVGWFGALLVGYLLGYGGEALLAVAFAGIYVFSQELTNYCRSIYEAFENLRTEAIMLIAEKALVIAGGLVLLIQTRSAHWTLAGMALGMAIATAVNGGYVHKHLAPIRLRLFDADFLKRSIKVMLPFGLAGLFTNIYFRVDMVMIEAMLGETPTGQYGAAFRILEALNMLPAIVAVAVIYPRLARLRSEGRHADFLRLMNQSLLSLVGLSTVIAVVLTFTASWVLQLLDPSPEFGPSVSALQWLTWAFPFYCANGLLYSALVTMNEEIYLAKLLGLAVILNVGMNFFAIPTLGIDGAAIATILPEVFLLLAYFSRYRTRISLK